MNAALLLLLIVCQDDPSRAKALLEETATKLKAAPAIAFERTFTQLSENSKEPYGQNLSRVVVRRPNQMRSDVTGKNWDMLTVVDGTNVWQLDRKKSEYSKYPQKGGTADYWFRDDPLTALFIEGSPARLLEGAGDFKLKTEKEGETAYDIVSWKAKLPRDGAQIGDLTLWIGPDRLPRRFVKQYEWRDTIYTHTSEYAKLELNPKTPDDTFAFTPPPDSKLRDPNEYRRQRIPTTEEAKKAQKILEAVQEAFRSSPTLRYELAVESGTPPVRRTFATLKRPSLMRMATGDNDSDASNLILCDGSDIWFTDASEKSYRKYAMVAGPTLHLGTTDPLAGIFFESGSPLVLSEATKVTVAQEELEGAACDVIGWTWSQSQAYSQKFKLWIGPDHRPRKMTTEWSSQGRTGSITSSYRSFDTSPTIAEGAFSFKPGADWYDLSNEQPGAKHLAVGTAAPDFEATDRGGAPLRLSELRGKPVVLVFGRYAHDGELDRAQEFHDAYGPRGVIVLAVSHGKKEAAYDPKKHTFRLMRLKDPEVAAAYGAKYWASLYLVDAGGKVAVATIGNDELKAAVEKLTAVTPAPAASPAAAGGEKEARETVGKAAEALKKAGSVAYPVTWHIKDSVGFTRFECKMQLCRPNLVRLDGAFRADYGRDDPCIFILDGKKEWVFSPNDKDRKYGCRPQPTTPAAGFYDDPVRLFFFGEPFTHWMDLATDLRQVSENLNGIPCTVVEWRTRYTSDVRWRLWIDGTSTVRRIEKQVGGQPFLAIEYGKIEVNPKQAEKTFVMEVPADAKLHNWRDDYEKKLIAVGADAPEFEAKDLEGKNVKLSAWRGKPVLFFAWYFP